MNQPARKTISVAQDDIIYGEHRSPQHCPIALACRRQFPNHLVRVTRHHLYVGKWTGELPKEASDFVRKFDVQRPIMRYFRRPFTFSVEFVNYSETTPSLDDTSEPVYKAEQ